MKKILLALSVVSAFNLHAEDLFYSGDKVSRITVKIYNVEGMRVNDKCFSNKDDCTSILLKKPLTPKNKKGVKSLPAVANCELLGGESLILRDQKNDSFDYCRFNHLYIINSEDLYKKTQK